MIPARHKFGPVGKDDPVCEFQRRPMIQDLSSPEVTLLPDDSGAIDGVAWSQIGHSSRSAVAKKNQRVPG
jgi:hypothetical protein